MSFLLGRNPRATLIRATALIVGAYVLFGYVLPYASRASFVIGDNRAMSIENHDFGRAARSRIVGKMLF